MSRDKRKTSSQRQAHDQKCGSQQVSNVNSSDRTQQGLLSQSAKNQEKSSASKEYEMMRTEILQYLEEYQSVRNMMYVATATILGINSLMFQNYYLFLLPLIVILPSYIIFYNYWRSVSCASTYIQVFLDNETVQTTYHWELRLRYFSELHKRNNSRVSDKLRGLDMHCHQIPYLLCSCLCLVLYMTNMLRKYISPYVQTTVGETLEACTAVFKAHFLVPEGYCLIATWHMLSDVLLGAIIIVLLIYIFITYWNMQDVEMTKTWERVKNIDMQQEEELRRKLGLHTKTNDSR